MIFAGRDGIAIQQDLVACEIALELAELVFDVEQLLLILEAGLLEGDLLGRDLQLQGGIGEDDEFRAALAHRAILDQHLRHRAALIGGEIVGDERDHRPAHRDVVLKGAGGDGGEGHAVQRHPVYVAL